MRDSASAESAKGTYLQPGQQVHYTSTHLGTIHTSVTPPAGR
jgi:hypothetical protein